MVKFQQRLKQGGVVLAEASGAAVHDEVAMTDEQHVNAGEPEQLQVVTRMMANCASTLRR